MHKRVFGALDHQIEQGIQALGQTELAQGRNAGHRMSGLQQLEHLVEHAALRNVGQQRFERAHGGGRLAVQLEPQAGQLGGKPCGTNDAHRVLTVARGRVTDQPQPSLACIFNAAVVIHHRLRARVVVHGIDGEVATCRIFVLRTPHVVAQHTATGIDCVRHARQRLLAGALVARHLLGRACIEIGAEGGDLDHLVLATATKHHVHDAETSADDEGSSKQRLDLLGGGIGGHVKVFGTQAQQQVSHRPAHDVGLEALVLQGMHHAQGALVHQPGIDAVFAGGDHATLAQ